MPYQIPLGRQTGHSPEPVYANSRAIDQEVDAMSLTSVLQTMQTYPFTLEEKDMRTLTDV